MGERHRRAHLEEKPQPARDVGTLAVAVGHQALTLDEFHDQVGSLVERSGIEQPRDVRMLQPGQDGALAREAPQQLGRAHRSHDGQHLHRHALLVEAVGADRRVDGAHASATDALDQAIGTGEAPREVLRIAARLGRTRRQGRTEVAVEGSTGPRIGDQQALELGGQFDALLLADTAQAIAALAGRELAELVEQTGDAWPVGRRHETPPGSPSGLSATRRKARARRQSRSTERSESDNTPAISALVMPAKNRISTRRASRSSFFSSRASPRSISSSSSSGTTKPGTSVESSTRRRPPPRFSAPWERA